MIVLYVFFTTLNAAHSCRMWVVTVQLKNWTYFATNWTCVPAFPPTLAPPKLLVPVPVVCGLVLDGRRARIGVRTHCSHCLHHGGNPNPLRHPTLLAGEWPYTLYVLPSYTFGCKFCLFILHHSITPHFIVLQICACRTCTLLVMS
jgi:hypothetical protein